MELKSGKKNHVLSIVSEIQINKQGKVTRIIGTTQDITEQRRVEFELKEKARLLEEAQKIAKLGNWQWDMIKDEITWSDLNYEVFGMPKSFKPNFEDLNAIIHPDDRQPFQKDVETAIAENRDHDFVHRIVLKEGKEIRYIHERGKVFYNEDGKPIRMAGTSQDVTAANEKEAKLEAQKTELNAINEKLQLSVEAGQVAIWIWDLETNELDWNDQAYKVFGVDKKNFEPTFENFATMIHPEDIIIVREATEKSIKTGDTFDIEFRFIWPDGEVRNLSGRGDVVFDEKGNPEKMIGINLDITERVKLYEQLKSQERQLRSFVQQAPVAVAMFDNEMRYITASNEWFKHNKIEQKNIVGQSHYEVIPEVRERKDWLEIHKRVLKGEEISRAKDQFATKDGEKIWLNWKAIPWYSVEGEIGGMIMYVSDISKDVEYTSQLENEVSERTLQVREKAKELKETNEELESFSYTISHDLRAPLRSINGFSDILLEEYAGQLDDEGKRLMNIVKQSAVTMGNLIDDILDFSRLGRKSLQKTDIDMNMLVESICAEEVGNYGEEKCNVNITELPNAKGDISLIKQVVTNLVSNAFKYSSHNELIKIDIDSYKKDKKNVYSFRDNGTGFKMEYHDKMFGVFQRLHSTKEFEGTGVGLAIVKRIINKHGGDVWAESEPGKGSTFFFSLPEN